MTVDEVIDVMIMHQYGCKQLDDTKVRTELRVAADACLHYLEKRKNTDEKA